MPKTFRAQYKTFGLTYSRCNYEKKDLLTHLQSLHSIEEYYIVQEEHKDVTEEHPEKFHLHAWFKTVDKPNIKNEAHFNWIGKHPNIGKKSRNWIFNYLRKFDKDPLTNIETGYVALAQSGQIQQALDQFAFMHPKDYVINFDRVNKHMRQLSKKPRPDKIYPFTGEVYEWDMENKSLLIIDEPGTGKTEWAKSFITHHLKKTYLRVTHLDGLKKYNGEDFIIYDDVNFTHLPRETQIHIAEVVNERSIHCRHTNADIPPGICNIFLSNINPFMHDPALQNRRIIRASSIRFY